MRVFPDRREPALKQLVFLTIGIAAIVCAPRMMATLCFGQDTQEHKSDSTQLLDGLRSNDPHTRVGAVEQIRSNSAMLQEPTVQSALLDLLDRENHESDAQIREEQRMQAEHKDNARESNDGNPQYIDDLLGTVESFADLHDPRQICLLVKAGYMPESPDASENAKRAQAAMSCLQQLSKSDLFMDRLKAVKIFVELLASAGGSLHPNTAQTLRQAVVLALHDKDEPVRVEAVESLERHGNSDMIPALQEVATSDPALTTDTHEFWIRKDAAKAVAAIEQREGRE